MSTIKYVMKLAQISVIKDALAETLWPTRCAICDKPGYLICPECARNLPYIDQLKSCPNCGEPFGLLQCCGCNGHNSFDNCVSVFFLNSETGKIITTYKDSGERRLAGVIAYFLSKSINPNWLGDKTFITYIPSSKEAYLRRGFDHARLIGESLSEHLNLKLVNSFNRPISQDQRELTRVQRAKNLSDKFSIRDEVKPVIGQVFDSAILIDDVFTTGATLASASLCLKKNNVKHVYCINFSRTF